MSCFLSSHKTLLSVALSASLLAGMTSCQDEDFGYAKDEIAYKTNFKKAFGEIPADKSWDLSSAANWVDPLKYYGAGSVTRGSQDATGPTKGKLQENTHFSRQTEYSWTVPSQLLSWLSTRLVEGNDNRYLGSSFMLKLPDNDFAIIPIFQGASAITSKLEVKINDYEITEIWSKSQGMKASDTGKESDLMQLGFYDGWVDYNQFEPKPSPAVSNYHYPAYQRHAASTIDAKLVKTTPIVINRANIEPAASAGSNVYMYLALQNIAKLWNGVAETATWYNPDTKRDETYRKEDENKELNFNKDSNGKYENGTMWDANDEWTKIGDRLTSIHPNGYMLAIDVDGTVVNHAKQGLPTINGQQPSELRIIGCEDANGVGSDHDVNDIVFLLVGYPNAPTIVPTSDVVSKRYMCEDLGGSNDFDFNDIVVDVEQTSYYNLESSPSMNSDAAWSQFFNTSRGGDSESIEISGISTTVFRREQKAKIAHVCGTLPIQAQVGDYLFPWITDPTDFDQTRKELKAGGWKKVNSEWVADNSNKKTRAKNEVLEDGWNPNETKTITGWDPASNNVTIYVKWPDNWHVQPGHSLDLLNDQNAANHSNPYLSSPNILNEEDFKDFTLNQLKAVTFPQNGHVPYIIAVDPSVNWMKECQPIDMEWLRAADHRAKSSVGEGSVGSGAYYEYPTATTKEVVVWEGAFTGEKWNHALQFKEAEHNGILEALNYDNCNTLNIYFDKGYTDNNNKSTKEISLIKARWEGRLTTTEADFYAVPRTKEVSVNGKSCYLMQIKLTTEQIEAIKTEGLSLQLMSDNVYIRKVSLTKESGFDINLTIPEHGKITTTAGRSRWREGDEAYTMRVPFTHASFISSTTLEASADAGYVFEGWYNGSQFVSANKSIEVNQAYSLEARFVEPYSVGIHYTIYNNDETIKQYDGTNDIGDTKLSLTSGTFYTKNSDNVFVPTNSTSVNIKAGDLVYVMPNTSITFEIPNNVDYVLSDANSFVNNKRTSVINNTNFTPYVNYKEKKDPNLQIGVTHIDFNYANTSADPTWSSESPAELKRKGYDYQTEVNIWMNNYKVGDKTGTFHVRPQKNDLTNKVITFYQEATDEYKSAEATFTVSVSDYYHEENGINAFRVPINESKVSASAVASVFEAQWDDNKLPDYIQIKVTRGTGFGEGTSLVVKSQDGAWVKTVRNASSNEWLSASSDFGWDGNVNGVNFWFSISKQDWIDHFKGKNIIFDVSAGLSIERVYAKDPSK